ncbi:MAG: glucose 1-dehydrogenase [Opitutus sp.]|nr:glucose 1-dehydrogenase [Opitutus sp.]
MSYSLKNKVALVTGASKGIGAAIAKHLGAAGASVVVNYSSSRTAADRVVNEITSAGGKAIAVQADVSKPDEVVRLLAETKAAYGKLDVLVNNAGVYEFGALEEITVDHFQRQFGLNVLGLLLTTKEAVALFPAEGGRVINISSAITRLNPPHTAVYTATKGAVDSISRVLAKELGPRKIRVNAINPGLVETEGTHTASIIGSDMATGVIAQTPLGRIGQPDDIAKAVVFIASDEGGWITGEVINVSGGA